MAGRKLRDEEDAIACLEAAEESGLSDAMWSRRHGIDGRSLHAWRLNLERRAKGPRDLGPLRVVELVPQRSAEVTQSARFHIRCGAFVVEVAPDFDRDALARVLEVVAAC